VLAILTIGVCQPEVLRHFCPKNAILQLLDEILGGGVCPKKIKKYFSKFRELNSSNPITTPKAIDYPSLPKIASLFR